MSPVTVTGEKVIVVGGGLAGMSAAHTVLERGGRVLVLDKQPFLGGNSTKATSGINGALTSVQQGYGIKDSKEQFLEDTRVGGKLTEASGLMKVLTYESGPGVEWLIEKFGLDLSLVSQLGGHSFARTHRGKEKFPGMTITYGLMEKFDILCKEDPSKAQVITLAKVVKLLQDANGAVTGVVFTKDGKEYHEYGPVILATGGFGADFASDSLLAKYRPDLLHLPTTNGEHCTGDGLKMAMAIEGANVDMESIQVHPTGLVNPKDPDAKVKFLAAEALRGVGGIILDKDGQRFVNELGTRDYVTGMMWDRKKGPYYLLLNTKASKELDWHCKHYVGRGLMKKFTSGADVAREMGVSTTVLKKTFDDYNVAARNGKDAYGKKYFNSHPFEMSENQFHLAIITPVVHYCMGGIKINTETGIVKNDGSAIPGLYAVGEVAGGVHGKNRLGGSGLLGCVVLGRVGGAAAAAYQYRHLTTGTAAKRASAITKQLGGITIQISFDGLNDEGAVAATVVPQKAAVVPEVKKVEVKQEAAAPKVLKKYTLEEIAKHNTEKDMWIGVKGKVLNVTDFMHRHPGGKPALLLFGGKDASEEFEMLHEDNVIEKFAPETIIGTYDMPSH